MRLRLPHTVVYWAPVAADKFGRPSFAAPVQRKARWEDRVDENISNDGTLVYSAARAYLSADVTVGGLMMRGKLTDATDSGFPANPRSDPRVNEIIARTSTPNLKGTQTLTIAFMK